MADAKYVVGDHRNGDAKIELDANKREFTGLTKEELMKYADDPFWVNLRWSLFVLFWAAWLCMLAGAIVIIVKAPKCLPPEPKKWFEVGPLVDLKSDGPEAAEMDLPLLKSFQVQGVFMEAPTYEVLEEPDVIKPYKSFFQKAKEFGIKVIVDLTPNFVTSLNNTWFRLSENRTEPYTNYFVWAPGKDFDAAGVQSPPNNWVSLQNTSAWAYSDTRREFYLQQLRDQRPDLNFSNPDVVAQLDKAVGAWMAAGASGVRLHNARQLLVDRTLPDEVADSGRGSSPGVGHMHYAYWRHRYTLDQPALSDLLKHVADKMHSGAADADVVFTLKETSDPELLVLRRNVSMLSPPAAAPLSVREDVDQLAAALNARLKYWPTLKLEAEDQDEEVAAFLMLLPASPVLDLSQLKHETNETLPSESLLHLIKMRSDVTIEHGDYAVVAVPAGNATENKLIVCARWKAGRSGYAAVYNPQPVELVGNLTRVTSLPPSLTVHHVSHAARELSNFTTNSPTEADAVLVPARSTVVLSYVPYTGVHE